MKKLLSYLVIFILLNLNCAIAKVKFAPLLPYTPYNPYESAEREDFSSDYPKINNAEKKLFGRTFTKEDITKRLSRIEKKLFDKDLQYLSLSERTENISQNIGLDTFSKISKNELAIMEQRIFMKLYPKDDDEMRITRLEKEIFGAMQGGDLQERFDTLKSATKYYNAFPPKLSNQIPYYSNPYHEAMQPSKITLPSVLKSIGSFFTPPTLTGYSPSIVYPNNIPYNNFTPFNDISRGFDRSFSRPGHSFNHFRHYGQGSSVNILQD